MTLNDFEYVIPGKTIVEVYTETGFMENTRREFGYAGGIYQENDLDDILHRYRRYAEAEIYRMEVREKRLKVYFIRDEHGLLRNKYGKEL